MPECVRFKQIGALLFQCVALCAECRRSNRQPSATTTDLAPGCVPKLHQYSHIHIHDDLCRKAPSYYAHMQLVC